MFQVPKSWEKGIVTLHFEAVNYKTEVWVNDQAVGIMRVDLLLFLSN